MSDESKDPGTDGIVTPELREQIFREATGAARVLQDPVFTSTLAELKMQFLNQFAQSTASEKNKREDAYWAIRSLDTITSSLSQRLERLRLLQEYEIENTEE